MEQPPSGSHLNQRNSGPEFYAMLEREKSSPQNNCLWKSDMVTSLTSSVESLLEGRYHYSKMFCWEPEGRYYHGNYTAIASFWFSMEHLRILIAPFWFSMEHLRIWIAPFWFSMEHFTNIDSAHSGSQLNILRPSGSQWNILTPFWFSMEHLWILIAPFWFSTDDIFKACPIRATEEIEWDVVISSMVYMAVTGSTCRSYFLTHSERRPQNIYWIIKLATRNFFIFITNQ